ncbi:hypothetical protein A8F94_06890 [Bacillus sp. FJAT-27225]|uniref:hypothetical protein n=1 Tax=Bacillus sp. FJAT-27225 TaxID=1743144 RepID=UPI00080C2782|nr:hypothetical protein [Bacillus sp. FJAT-27225]OCA87580.1 hypothetical protein A8F94_06890 [Bacillus sp. FJAT-27225]
MTILCAGVTGFEPAPSVDSVLFKKICQSVPGFRVVDFSPAHPGRNYHECSALTEEGRFRILLNAHYPYLAFAKSEALEFLDKPGLTGMFEQHYQVLSPLQLSEPLHFGKKGKKIYVVNENTLHEADLLQLAYWRPGTVGEAVFNHWD